MRSFFRFARGDPDVSGSPRCTFLLSAPPFGAGGTFYAGRLCLLYLSIHTLCMMGNRQSRQTPFTSDLMARGGWNWNVHMCAGSL